MSDEPIAREFCQHFNKIISHIVELDEKIDCRKFDIWRGIAAGTPAQVFLQNIKEKKVEFII